ncbi:DUF6069 family protein [Dactylosporangium cerinum]|uniref:DUF6069 family protein n=1 Tax=Dactylosporangium cerinum TaxID=1434730 RepID=A0ABV9WBX2_9ACTN
MTTTPTSSRAATARIGALIGVGVAAAVIASAATTAVAAVGRAAGISLTMNDEAIPVSGFGALTAIFSLVGVVLAVVLARFTRHPRRIFVRTIVALTALSLLPDVLSIAAPATKALFMSAHLIAAAIVIPAVAHGNGAQQWTLQSDGAVEALGKCLDVPGGQTGNGTQLWLWDCTGGANQQWRPGPNGALVNPSSGRCLDSPGGSTSVGARLQIWDCVGNAAQRFTLPARVAGQITGVANRCVDIQGVSAGDAANGRAVGLWDCNGLSWQQWTVRGDGEIQASAGAGRCLETPGGATAPGTAVQVWDCAGSPWTNQKWWVRSDGSIVNLRSNLCLDTQNGATGNGTRLVINPCDGRASQRWRRP